MMNGNSGTKSSTLHSLAYQAPSSPQISCITFMISKNATVSFLLNEAFTSEQQYHDEGEHQAIMQAVLARDVDLAHQLLIQHTERLYHILEKLLEYKI